MRCCVLLSLHFAHESSVVPYDDMKTIVVTILAIAVVLGGALFIYSLMSGRTGDDADRTVINRTTFTCTDGTELDATFYSEESMALTLDGTTYELPQVVSASGARYANSDESFVFWNKGNEATVFVDGSVAYEGCVAEGAAERYTTAVIENGYALSFVPPQGGTVSVERDTYYKVLYAGPSNEPPALTDGYTITMTLLDKDPSASFRAFVESERDSIRTAVGAPLSETTLSGRDAYVFSYETELGTDATDTFALVDDETVARVTVSAVGPNAQGYRSTINDVLDSIVFEAIGGAASSVMDLIQVTNLAPGDVIESPLTIEGEARGPWYFEATFPIVLTDWDGRIIAEGYAEAEGNWMTEEFVPFSATIEFASPYADGDPDFMKRGSLILQKANASGLPEHDAAYEMTVYFAE